MRDQLVSLRLASAVVLVALSSACRAPIGPATREGFGVPYPSLAAAQAAVDSIESAVIIVVDTVVLESGAATPTPREIARVRLVRNNTRCGRRNFSCPSIIWVETKRPQWSPE